MQLGIVGDLLNNLLRATYSVISQEEVGKSKIVLEFDTIDECTMNASATATQYPTEYGTSATDYKYAQSSVVSMRGLISRGGIFGTGTAIEFARNKGKLKTSIIEDLRDSLKKLKNELILVDINTRNGGLWENMTLIDYVISETADNFSLFEVEMTFQQVFRKNLQNENAANVSDTNTKQTGIAQTQTVK